MAGPKKSLAGRCLSVVGALGALVALVMTAPGAGALGVSPPGIPGPTGRWLTPAGRLITGGDFPASAVLAGDGFYAADNGQSVGSIVAVSPDPGNATMSAGLLSALPPPTSGKPTANSGRLSVSRDGQHLYLPGAALGVLHTFAVGQPGVAPVETSTVGIGGRPNIWGAAGTADGSVLVTHTFQQDGLGPSRDQGNTVLKVDPRTGAVLGTATVGREPFGIVDGLVPGAAPDAPAVERVVSLDRGSGQLSVIDPATMGVVAVVGVARQPADAVFAGGGRDLLVSCSLDDVLLDVDTTTWTVKSRLDLRPVAGLGAGPSAITVDPSGQNAYVALGADNAVAVLARQPDGSWAEQGEIPTAAYPTGVAYDPPSTRHPAQLLITAGKGTGLPAGTPIGAPEAAVNNGNPTQTGTGLSGSLELVAVPAAAALASYTTQVAQNNQVTAPTPGCPVPSSLRGISHVVYVIRENKTYDQEFGDTTYGDPGLVMYPRAITPNTHAVAERSALLGNFYSDEEVSDTGHAAAMGGVANDFLQRTTQQSYGLGGTPRQGPELGNDDSTVWSPSNFLLDDALTAGITFRDYGEFYRHNQQNDGQAESPALQSHIITGFPGFGFDPNTPDTKRIDYWTQGFHQDVANGTFPALEVLYLPEDHTTNNTPTPAQPVPPTPQQQVADSDLATGRLVSALSNSPYWNSTAVFLTEDDPQSGMDHVDDHRTIGLVTGGRARQQATTTHYDSGSMLRTIEEILRLPAMTEFDATARPMDDLFTPTPDPVNSTPYTPVTPAGLPTATATATATAAAPAPAARAGSPSTLSPAAQFAAQWQATHGSQPIPAPLPRPAWAQTSPKQGDSALAATPGGCATPPALPEAPRTALLLLTATLTGLGVAVLRHRPRRRTRL